MLLCDLCEQKEKPYHEAVAYCPDCPLRQRLLCRVCVIKEHHATSRKKYHSVEEILPVDPSIPFITSLLDVFLLPAIVYHLFSCSRIEAADYAAGEDICPVVKFTRSTLYAWDSGLGALMKTFVAQVCALEDGYWRFLTDAWIRGVVTSTDTWFLLLVSLPRALIFRYTFKKWLIDPTMCLIHAVVCAAFSVVRTPSPEEAPRLWHIVHCMQLVVDKGVNVQLRPPFTAHRARPDMNVAEGALYSINRRLRRLKYYYFSASARVSAFFTTWGLSTLVFRILCITIDAGRGLRWVLMQLGFARTIEAHTQSFCAFSAYEASDLFLRDMMSWFVTSIAWFLLILLICLAVPAVGVGVVLFRQTKVFKESAKEASAESCECSLLWPGAHK